MLGPGSGHQSKATTASAGRDGKDENQIIRPTKKPGAGREYFLGLAKKRGPSQSAPNSTSCCRSTRADGLAQAFPCGYAVVDFITEQAAHFARLELLPAHHKSPPSVEDGAAFGEHSTNRSSRTLHLEGDITSRPNAYLSTLTNTTNITPEAPTQGRKDY
jgi:hypothetical protein